jgi:hypothetical protein
MRNPVSFVEGSFHERLIWLVETLVAASEVGEFGGLRVVAVASFDGMESPSLLVAAT